MGGRHQVRCWPGLVPGQFGVCWASNWRISSACATATGDADSRQRPGRRPGVVAAP